MVLINLLSVTCILRYDLFLDVLIDICFVLLCIYSTWLIPIEDIVDAVFESNNDSYVLHI